MLEQSGKGPREVQLLKGLPTEISWSHLAAGTDPRAERVVDLSLLRSVPDNSTSASLDSIIRVESIPLEESLVRGHLFENLIRTQKILSTRELQGLQQSLNLLVHVYDSGAIPAASNPASSYSVHSWTRDTAIVARSLFARNNRADCLKALVHLASFYGDALQRDRFIGFHFHPDPVWLYRHGDSRRSLPHVRARIEDGRLRESPDEWSHSQLDAIGMWLGVTFQIANLMKLNLRGLDTYLTERVNPLNQVDSIFSVALRFLCRIRFWEQHDHGAWEDRQEPARASSTGACVMAIREAITYFDQYGWERITIHDSEGQPTLRQELQEALRLGSAALARRIPENGDDAIETENFRSDAALTFLLFPFDPGLSALQQRGILKVLYRDRLGPVGFSRRDHDEYVGQDYAHNPNNPIFVDPNLSGYRPAEWTLFDPLLGAYFYQRFIDSKGLDLESLKLADRHLKRSISQVTSREDTYWKACEQRMVVVPALRIPEAYWWDSQAGRWRPNENSPLLMAEAACALMLERGLQAAALFERQAL
jgi:hypothetical protein